MTQLNSQNLSWFDEKVKDPGWARSYLVATGLLNSKGEWNPLYWPPSETKAPG